MGHSPDMTFRVIRNGTISLPQGSGGGGGALWFSRGTSYFFGMVEWNVRNSVIGPETHFQLQTLLARFSFASFLATGLLDMGIEPDLERAVSNLHCP